MTFRTRLFLSSLVAAALTLLVATILVSGLVRRSLEDQIQQSLVNEARLAAETLSHRRAATPEELDAEADALGRQVSARVTFVAPDGTVVGDSELSTDALRALENHAGRPEIQQSRAQGLGIARRYSTTLATDMLYVAVPVRNPDAPLLAEIRLALPLTVIGTQLASLRRLALVAFGVGLLAALALAWGASALVSRRVRAIAAVAERYAAGDFSHPARDYGTDEIGRVARVLDESVREIGRRASDLESDRARMEAILGGMIEGVLVVNDQGRVQLVNDAARRMLRLQDAPEGRHYLEIVRQPDIAERLGATLRGATTEGLELALPRESDRSIIARSAPVRTASARGAVLVLHDITELRKADRIRRDFVANVSHELRTPLTAVRGYVEAQQVTDEPLEHVLCAVESLFTGVETELADSIEGREQTVEQQIGGDATTVMGDPAKLHDALRNLLENASNYSPVGGRIVMASARTGDRLHLTVSDDGPGVPDADLPRIFERFYRADKARSRGERDPGGTGLGLAIVKHLIELHGGTVSAVNRRPRGAVFTIDLPG